MEKKFIMIKTVHTYNLPTKTGRGSLLDMPNTVAAKVEVGDDLFIWHKPSGVKIAAIIEAIHPNSVGGYDIIYREGKPVTYLEIEKLWSPGPGYLRYIPHPMEA